MAILLASTGIVLLIIHLTLLRKSADQSFVITAITKWYESNGKTSDIEPQIAKEFMTSPGFKSAKGITGLLMVVWLMTVMIGQHWVALAGGLLGLVVAVLIVKATRTSFSVSEAVKSSHGVVLSKRRNIGQLNTKDIVDNTPKSQLSSLDFLLENKEFITFAIKLKRESFGGK